MSETPRTDAAWRELGQRSIRIPGKRYGAEAISVVRKSDMAALESDRAELIEFLHEFVNAGVSFEDPRVDYMEIQINSDTMSQAAALLARLASEK